MRQKLGHSWQETDFVTTQTYIETRMSTQPFNQERERERQSVGAERLKETEKKQVREGTNHISSEKRR